MLKLNKKTEYALIAIRYIMKKSAGEWASVHEMGELYGISVEVLAKVMQKLKRAGVVVSVQGFGGGYALNLPLTEVPFLKFLDIFGERLALTDCCNAAEDPCFRLDRCEISRVMTALNERLMKELRGLSLADVLDLDAPPTADETAHADRATPDAPPLPARNA